MDTSISVTFRIGDSVSSIFCSDITDKVERHEGHILKIDCLIGWIDDVLEELNELLVGNFVLVAEVFSVIDRTEFDV